MSKEEVNHPDHYGGGDNPYEVIKVLDSWDVGFNLGNVVKYVARARHKGRQLQDLKKAQFYLQHEIARLEKEALHENDEIAKWAEKVVPSGEAK